MAIYNNTRKNRRRLEEEMNMKRFTVLALAFLMALTLTVAQAGPSKTVNDLTSVTIVTDGTAPWNGIDMMVGKLNPDEDPVIAANKANTVDALLKTLLNTLTTDQTAGANTSAGGILLTNALNSMNTIVDANADPAATFTVPAVTAESVLALNTAIIDKFATLAGYTADELNEDPQKMTDLMNKLNANDVVAVSELNYDPTYGNVTVNYKLPTKYEMDQPVLIVLDTTFIDDPYATSDAENKMPTQIIMPLETTVLEDGSLNAVYTPEAVAQIDTEDTASMIFTLALPSDTAEN